MEFELDGRRHRVDIWRENGGWCATVDGRLLRVDVHRVGDRWSLLLDRHAFEAHPADGEGSGAASVRVSYEVAVDARAPGEFLVHVDGHPVALSLATTGRSARGATDGEQPLAAPQQVVAPMPGRIVKVLVAPGDLVQPRQPLVVIEAMKMENELRATGGGIVAEVLAAEGALVEARAVLVVLR